MKKYLLFLPLAFTLVISSCTQQQHIVGTKESPAILVKGGSFSINTDDVISSSWNLAKMQDALGKADRDRDGYNITHTYDEKGIVLFEPKNGEDGSGTVSEVQIYLQHPEQNNVTPTGDGFKGTLMIDNVTINQHLGSSQMLKKLKKWKKTDSYMEHNYRMACKGLYIYFLFNDEENSLIKVSIGPDKR